MSDVGTDIEGRVVPSSVSTNETEDDMFEKLFSLYIPPVKERIRLRSDEISKKNNNDAPTAKDIMAAIQEYIPGEPYTPMKPRWGWINQNVTGFMAITAFMTLTFGVLGMALPTQAGGFLEIAKIFAGALVGGAAGAAAGSRRS